jgi:hypothetical protein
VSFSFFIYVNLPLFRGSVPKSFNSQDHVTFFCTLVNFSSCIYKFASLNIYITVERNIYIFYLVHDRDRRLYLGSVCVILQVPPRPNTYMPFGNGVHACPGSELAKLEMLILLHHLTTSYRSSSLSPPHTCLYTVGN